MRSHSLRRTHGRGGRAAIALVVALGMVLAMLPATAFAGWYEVSGPQLVSRNAFGEPGNNWSDYPSISYDGQYVAFTSRASNLSPEDKNLSGDGEKDVFIRDMLKPGATLVSVTPDDAQEPDRGARDISISSNGRYAAFVTGRDMVPEDDNGDQDLYIKDLATGEYMRADIMGDGSSPGDSIEDLRISGNGEYVVFDTWNGIDPSDSNGRRDVYLWSVLDEELTWVSETPPGASLTTRGSKNAGISDDGQTVAFLSGNDFVAGDTNGDQDLYLYDVATGDHTWLDIMGDGSSPDDLWYLQLSGDGQSIVFTTWNDLAPEDTNGRADVYMWSVADEELIWVSETPDGAIDSDRGARNGTTNADGTLVAFFTGRDFVPDDVNGEQDIYLRDMVTGEFTRIPITKDPDASPGDDIDRLALSGDGSKLAFSWEPSGGIKSLSADYDPASDDVSAAAVLSYEEQVYVVDLDGILEPGSSRVSGADRYGTAVAVSAETFPSGAHTAVIVTGANWPDALCASALAGAVGGPILLTRPDALPAEVKAELERLGVRNAYIVGGTAAVSAGVEDALYGVLPGYVFRLGGADRYGTSRAVANHVIALLGASYDRKALVATGSNYPDALAGAPIAAGLDRPILLANVAAGSVYVPADTDEVMILGGRMAVPDAIEATLKTALGDDAVDRVGGATRYDTAAQVAQAGVDAGLMWNGVGIASGEAFPDALAGGAAVGMQRSVLLLTPAASLDSYTKAALEANKDDITTVRFFGGTVALSEVVENAVKAALGM